MRKLSLLSTAALAVCLLSFAGATPAPEEPVRQTLTPGPDGKVPSITWDVADDRNPKNVNWPKDAGNNKVFTLEGDFEFHLKVKDGKNYDGRVRQVQARRNGQLIEGVELTAQPETTEQAYNRTKTMLENLGFGEKDMDKLEAWYTKAKTGNFDNLELSFKNSYDRVYTVHIVNDGTSEQPWSVGLDIDWSKVCGCHG